MIEEGHLFVKSLTQPMLGFKAFHSGAARLGKAKIAHMIRKGQFDQTGVAPVAEIAALTA
jgi:putative transposase